MTLISLLIVDLCMPISLVNIFFFLYEHLPFKEKVNWELHWGGGAGEGREGQEREDRECQGGGAEEGREYQGGIYREGRGGEGREGMAGDGSEGQAGEGMQGQGGEGREGQAFNGQEPSSQPSQGAIMEYGERKYLTFEIRKIYILN